MEKISWLEKVRNGVIEWRKANWIVHILRINCRFHDVIEGQITEVKGVGRRTDVLDNLRSRKKV
jgi:hypothetical protein